MKKDKKEKKKKIDNDFIKENKDIQSNLNLYDEYVKAESVYLKKPTSENWDNKEKAFEAYSQFIKVQRILKEAGNTDSGLPLS